MFLVLLRPIFGEKLKTAPPKEIGCRSCEVHVVIRSKKALEYPILAEKSVSISVKTFLFFFGNHLFLGGKNVRISDSGRKISLNFGEDLFFFLRSPGFGRKDRFYIIPSLLHLLLKFFQAFH